MKDLTFIDLFAGIGGMRIAFERAGCRCVFTSEWDKFAQKTYQANFLERPHGDIRAIRSESILDHDILVAGFPCQPFSISGVSKKQSLGRPTGFADPTQGTLFFEIKRILEDKQPRAFLLENVKNLLSHDRGRTFDIIKETLSKLGYHVHYKVLDASFYVPQHRQRIFIVGFKHPLAFSFPEPPAGPSPQINEILDSRVPEKYTLSDKLWQYLQDYAAKHKKAGNGFGFGLTPRSGRARTLSARYYKDGSEILIPQRGKNPRRLTPRECSKLMGFPASYKIPVSDTQAYKQFGNSVAVPVVEAVAQGIVRSLTAQHKKVA